jgi:peroxidase
MNTCIALVLFFTLAGHAGPGLAQLQTREHTCDATAVFRTIDGKCNNIDNPSFGASVTPFARYLPATYSGDGTLPRVARSGMPLPNARLVSSSLHTDTNVPDTTATNAFIMFGLFLDHGITETPFIPNVAGASVATCCGDNMAAVECNPITPIVHDPFFSKQRKPQTCFPLTRSLDCFSNPNPLCTENSKLRVDTSAFELREQVNGNPAFVDLSTVYGFNDNYAGNLRTGSGGKLRSTITASGNELLPILPDPTVDEVDFAAAVGKCLNETNENTASKCVFHGGDFRARENPLLTTWHTLWLREHNRVASALASINQQLTDEELYQNARRCVIAEFQNTVYGEWLPILLGADAVTKFGLDVDGGNGYKPDVDASIRNGFAAAAFRFGHSMLQGSYRSTPASGDSTTLMLRDLFFNPTSYSANDGEGADKLMRGLIEQPSQKFDGFITADVTNFLFPPTATACFGEDLAARDLQRARDHGIPGFLRFLEFCGLSYGNGWHGNDWSHRPSIISLDAWKKLQNVYESPEDIDLLTGGYFETPLSGGLIGPVLNCLIGMQFQFLREGDRFFFTHTDQVGSFTGSQIAAIKNRSLRDVICDNFPGIVEARPKTFLLNSPFESCGQKMNLDLSIFVPASPAPACVDILNQNRCQHFKNRGRCNRQFVKARCQKTCGIC